MQAIEAILPLKIDAREGVSELDRFSTLFLPSLHRFLRSEGCFSLLLIVPAQDLSAVRKRLKKLDRSEVRVICEDDLCPALKGHSGWYKQQILKIAAAKLLSSEYYLVLDADIILKRPTDLDDLFPSGKPILQKEKASTHWNEWMASRQILKSCVDLAPDSIVMDVTPEFLHRETCLALQGAIASRNNTSEWDKFLFESRETGWTEYSLYWLYVLELGLGRQLYDWSPVQMYDGIFNLCEADRLSHSHLQHIFAPDSDSFFLVVQSNMNLKLSLIQERILPYLRGPRDTSPGANKRFLGNIRTYLKNTFSHRRTPPRL
jgi:hypothetical protein